MEFVLGYEVIRSYKRLSYTAWHSLAEFVDNSTQAYLDNRSELEATWTSADEPRVLRVDVVYDADKGLIRVSDNSIGMDLDDLDHAMHVGAPPANMTGRSRYGMGLKTAACWLGDEWTVRTSKLGSPTEYLVTVVVDDVAAGQAELPVSEQTVEADDHYTVIEIRELNRRFHPRTQGKIKDYLRSMYREDLQQGYLRLTWQDEELRWEDYGARFLTDPSGNPYKLDLNFDVDGKEVSGWVGVLERGSRSDAGFSILHSHRVVKGWPDSWRPEEIFGQIQGSNDLVNQRLVGEFNLDAFEVTHTKDDVLWAQGEEGAVQGEIKERIADLIVVAKTARVRKKTGPGRGSIKEVSRRVQDQVVKGPKSKPAPDHVEARARAREADAMAEKFTPTTPDISGTLYGLTIHAYLSDEEAAEALYLAIPDELPDSDPITIVANLRHPFLKDVSTSEALGVYLRTLLVDVLAHALEERWTDLPERITLRDAMMREWGEPNEGSL